jgi:hypothetical protein
MAKSADLDRASLSAMFRAAAIEDLAHIDEVDCDEWTRERLREGLLAEIENPDDWAPWDEVRERLRAKGLWHID